MKLLAMKWLRGTTLFSVAGLAGVVGVAVMTDALPCAKSNTVQAAEKDAVSADAAATCPLKAAKAAKAEAKLTADKGECCASKAAGAVAKNEEGVKVVPAVVTTAEGAPECAKTKAAAAAAGTCDKGAKAAVAKGEACEKGVKAAVAEGATCEKGAKAAVAKAEADGSVKVVPAVVKAEAGKECCASKTKGAVAPAKDDAPVNVAQAQ